MVTKIDAKGLHPTENKIVAIRNAVRPKNIQELRAFCGMIQYYHKFFPNLSTILAPLYRLLSTKSTWVWSHEQEKAFQDCKSMLTSTSVLIHYDPKLPILIESDASSVGVGSVLSHIMEDGMTRPIAFASKFLHPSEKIIPS